MLGLFLFFNGKSENEMQRNVEQMENGGAENAHIQWNVTRRLTRPHFIGAQLLEVIDIEGIG